MFKSFNKERKKQKNKSLPSQTHDFPLKIFTKVKDNIENIQQILHSPSDLVTRMFTIGDTNHPCAIICIDGLVDKDLINDKIIQNIQLEISGENIEVPYSSMAMISQLENAILSIYEVKKVHTLDDVMLAVLSGDTALFVDGTDEVLIIGSKGWASRGVEEPATEALVRGPREGFTENIRTNTVHIRRRVRDPNLRFVSYHVGRRSKKDMIMAYVDGITHPDIIKEVKRRIETINIDDVPESGYIEQWIEDSFLSPFPQVQHTERPDKVCAGLLQGKVAILLDGTPFVLVVPVTLGTLLHSPEDYYERWIIGTLLRILRFGAAFIALFLPAIYIALVSYHQGMIPSKLAFFMAGSREGVPFPAIVEAMMMEATLELLREAGLRLPKPIGQAIGIVGGLVIGEAAVSAGIVSPVMVIVVAVTAISSFAIPTYSVAISFRILRFGVMLAAAILGLYGIIMVYIMINIHIANLKSFGIPYSTPFAPSFYSDWKDLVLRAPLTMLSNRPQFMQTEDETRMEKGGNSS